MKQRVKVFLLHFFLSGLLFGIGMYVLDNLDGKDFSVLKFVLRFVVFGLGMAIIQEVLGQPRNKARS